MTKVKPPQAKSKQRRTQSKPPAGSPPERFFEKDLAGEEAPSFQTMQALFKHAGAIYTDRPWESLEEHELVMFKDSASGELCFCSVMGALGESSAVQVYIGAQSYFWFKKLHAGEPASLGDFYAHQRSVFVHYVSLSHLTPPDRQLARAMGHPLARGTEAPLIRTIRPGYHPWFVTESEARILAQGLQCVLAITEYIDENPDDDFWIQEGVYPFMELVAQRPDRLEYRIQRMAGPSEAATMPKLPELEQARIQPILHRRFPSAGPLDVDHFYSAAVIGAKHDRKACMRIALAIDSKTAIAFPPQLGTPEECTGEMLQKVVLGAIETMHALPVEIHVSKREFKILLDPLAVALGFRVKVRDSLPALEFAKGEMQTMLGDPGMAP